jgi:hypothetical protein
MNNLSSIQKKIFWTAVFGIAMGLLECTVVIYLRAIYYPAGFNFPLQPIDQQTLLVEMSREVATIIMLLCIGIITGRSFLQRFGFFIFAFAVWDIFYYVFLKTFLNWPASIFTWDILFLIPLVWTSPVLCPVIVSFTMVILGLLLILGWEKNEKLALNTKIWAFFISGALILVFSFMLDFIKFLQEFLTYKELVSVLKHNQVMRVSSVYIPGDFNWWLFVLGELIVLVGIGFVVMKMKKAKMQ